jgi:hypothetical protein
MSIDLDIKINEEKIPFVDQIISSVIDQWKSLSIDDLDIQFIKDQEGNCKLLENCDFIEFSVSDRARVTCHFFEVPQIGDSDDEPGGLWGSVSIDKRNAESVFLMCVAAVGLARAAESAIVDESNIMKLGRIVAIGQAIKTLSQVKGMSLSEAAKLF